MEKNKRKKGIFLYFGIVIVSMILFNKFMIDYYTFDTYKVIALGYDGYALSTSLSEGRIFMGIFMLILNFFRIPINITISVTSVFSILISSIVVFIMHKLTVKKEHNGIQKILNIILNYFLVFNFMYVDNLRFLENIVMSVSLLLYTFAAIDLVNNKFVKSSALVLLGILSYQGTFSWFLLFVLYLAIIKNENNYKEILKTVFVSCVEVGLSVIALFVYMKVYNNIFDIQLNRFSESIFSNFSNIFYDLYVIIINSSNLFPSYIFIAYIIGIFILGLSYKDKSIKLNIPIITVYSILVCIPILVISNVAIESTGRIFFPIGAIISLLFLYLHEKQPKKCSRMMIIMIFGYGIISIYNSFVVTSCYKVGNEVDKKICENVSDYIIKYQNENNIYIKQIAIKTSEKINLNKILEIDGPEKKMRKLPISYIYAENKISNLLMYYNNIKIKETEFDENIAVTSENGNTYNYSVIDDTLYVFVK